MQMDIPAYLGDSRPASFAHVMLPLYTWSRNALKAGLEGREYGQSWSRLLGCILKVWKRETRSKAVLFWLAQSKGKHDAHLSRLTTTGDRSIFGNHQATAQQTMSYFPAACRLIRRLGG